MAGKTVLADAQFGIARILRPFSGFETRYQGKPSTQQIELTEVVTPPGGEALDPLAAAGTPGYDPNLVKGLVVPFGARVVIWIPKILASDAIAFTFVRYKWTIGWRLRNVFDYRQARMPYHYPKQGEGVPDTTAGLPGAPRVVIPAANQTVIYNQEPQPAGVSDPVAASMRIEDVTAGGDYPTNGAAVRGLPLTPSGALGAIQQGVLNPASVFGSSGRAQSPFWQIHEVQAVGDELVIGLWRDEVTTPNWDFAGTDVEVQNFLGNGTQGVRPDVGVYVLVGSAP